MPKPIVGLTHAARHVQQQARMPPKGGYLARYAIDRKLATLHVGTSDLAVARLVWRQARRRKMPRTLARAHARYAILEMRRLRQLYRDVMRGRL